MNHKKAEPYESIMDWNEHFKRCGVAVPISKLASEKPFVFIG